MTYKYLIKGVIITFILIFCRAMDNFAWSQHYVDKAEEKGINVSFHSSLFGWGSGVSSFDFTGNGRDDLTFATEHEEIVFYVNNNGVFEKESLLTFNEGSIKHVIWVDYNNNGKPDLFVTQWDGPYKLFENTGDLNFVDVSLEAGLSSVSANHYGASWGDYNRNGYLDLYITKYHSGFESDEDTARKTNTLYRNNGNGTFTDVTHKAGVGDGIKTSFQSIWFDYNNNGWVDLFVINDRTIYPNSLYRNNGDGTFTNVAEEAGAAITENNPMSLSVADFNNNGYFDIYMTNTGRSLPGRLLVNNGDGTFTEAGEQYNVALPYWGWGAVWVDYNNNTYQDLYAVTGTRDKTTNFFYRNINGQYFEPDTSIFNGKNYGNSYAAAKGDFNNNGYYDIVVQNNLPDNAFLWKNTGGENNYIKLTLKGTASNNNAIGSRIEVYAEDNKYTRFTFCGENYVSQNSQHNIFGMAQYKQADSVKVHYPLGHTDTYYNLKANKHYYLTEGETWEISLDKSGNIALCENDSLEVEVQAENADSITWNNGHNDQSITITESGQYYALVKSQHGIVAYSDTVTVNVNSLPDIHPSVQHVSCAGSNDGKVKLNIYDPGENYELTWESGDTSASINKLSEGVYTYHYTDNAGCRITDSVEVLAPDEIRTNKKVEHVSENDAGSIDVQISGGTPPYQVFLNDQAVEPPVEGLEVGIYELKIRDDKGCEYISEIEISGPVSLSHVSGEESIVFFPNPVSNEVFSFKTEQTLSNLAFIIVDLSGKVVYRSFFNILEPGTHSINIGDLYSGIYQVHIEAASGKHSGKVIIE